MQTNDWVISRERVCTPMHLSEPVQEQSIELDYTLPDYFPDFFRLLHCFAEPRITAQKTADDAVQYTLTDRESVEEEKKKRLWMTTTALRRY